MAPRRNYGKGHYLFDVEVGITVGVTESWFFSRGSYNLCTKIELGACVCKIFNVTSFKNYCVPNSVKVVESSIFIG